MKLGENDYLMRLHLGPFLFQTLFVSVTPFDLATSTPFMLTVVTDSNEVLGGTGMANEAHLNEASANEANIGGSQFPLGTMGFSVMYSQRTCVPQGTTNKYG